MAPITDNTKLPAPKINSRILTIYERV